MDRDTTGRTPVQLNLPLQIDLFEGVEPSEALSAAKRRLATGVAMVDELAKRRGRPGE